LVSRYFHGKPIDISRNIASEILGWANVLNDPAFEFWQGRQDLGPTQSYSYGTWALFPGEGEGVLERSGRGVNHSRPSSAEVKNEWNYLHSRYTPLWRGQGNFLF